MSFAEVERPKAAASTCTPCDFRYSTSGMKSPSPETTTRASIFEASFTASTARPTSQSAFFAPPENICKFFVFVYIPAFSRASKNAFSSPDSVVITYAVARTKTLPATHSSSTFLKLTLEL